MYLIIQLVALKKRGVGKHYKKDDFRSGWVINIDNEKTSVLEILIKHFEKDKSTGRAIQST